MTCSSSDMDSGEEVLDMSDAIRVSGNKNEFILQTSDADLNIRLGWYATLFPITVSKLDFQSKV